MNQDDPYRITEGARALVETALTHAGLSQDDRVTPVGLFEAYTLLLGAVRLFEWTCDQYSDHEGDWADLRDETLESVDIEELRIH